MFGLRKKVKKQQKQLEQMHQELILIRTDMTRFKSTYHKMLKDKQTVMHLKQYAFEQPDVALKEEISARLEDSYSPLFQSATLPYHFSDAKQVEHVVLNNKTFNDLPTHHNLKLVQQIMPKILNRHNYRATNYWLNKMYHYRQHMGNMRIKVASGHSHDTKMKHHLTHRKN